MATFEFTLRGDQIGTYSSYSGSGNNDDRVLTVNDVEALGARTETYTIRVEQARFDETQFSNGQWVTILDSSGNVVSGPTSVQPDDENGMLAGDEHLILRGSNFLIDVGGIEDGPETRHYSKADEIANSSRGDNDGELDFADTNSNFPCFGRSTRIRTPDGDKLVETLKEGDLVSTLDHGPQPIVWKRSRLLQFQSREDRELPVLVPAGALAKTCPDQDLLLSPQHCLLVEGSEVAADYLLPAKGMLGGPIRRKRGCKSIEYFSLLFESHQLIWANNCLCESTYPGDYLMASLPLTYKAALLRRFPLLRLGAKIGYGPRARERRNVQAAKRMALLLKHAPKFYVSAEAHRRSA